MHVLSPRWCGLDIHQKTVVACVLLTEGDGTSQRFVRPVGTMTADLLALGDWLTCPDVRHVAREERTGVLWRPVCNVLEEGRTLILVNAQHIKALPGRKTDVKDSAWLADPARARACYAPVLSRRSPSAAHPRPARSHPLSEVARPATHPRDQSRPQSAGNGQPETGGRGEQCGRRQWAADAARGRTRGV